MTDFFEVLWAENAEVDLTLIIAHISEDSPMTAKSVLDKIKSKVSSLETLPDRGRIVPELQKFGILQYRELIISPWRIIYRISDNRVYILLMIDSRRDLEDILFQRLITGMT